MKDLDEELLTAASKGELITAERLIRDGANVNVKDRKDFTCLHWAAQDGHSDMALLLISYGADINAVLKDTYSFYYSENTPLQWAVYWNHLNVVKVLVEQGADVNTPVDTPYTPLRLAAKKGRNDIVKYLIEQGANIHLVYEDGSIPLLDAAFGGEETVQLFLDAGAVADPKGVYNTDTLLHGAASSGAIKFARHLLLNGADVNTRNLQGVTPVYDASLNNQIDIVRLLIEHGADIDVPHYNNLTPLHRAAAAGFLELVKLLVEHGANVNPNMESSPPNPRMLPHSSSPLSYMQSPNGGYKSEVHKEIHILLTKHGAELFPKPGQRNLFSKGRAKGPKL